MDKDKAWSSKNGRPRKDKGTGDSESEEPAQDRVRG